MEGLANYGSEEELECNIDAAERRSLSIQKCDKLKFTSRRRSRSSSKSNNAKSDEEDYHQTARSHRSEKKPDRLSYKCKVSDKTSAHKYRNAREQDYEPKHARVSDKSQERKDKNERDHRERNYRDKRDKEERYENKGHYKDAKDNKNRETFSYKQERRREERRDDTRVDRTNYDEKYSRHDSERNRRHRDVDARPRSRYENERTGKHDYYNPRMRVEAQQRIHSPSTTNATSSERRRKYSRSRSNSPAHRIKTHGEVKSRARFDEQMIENKELSEKSNGNASKTGGSTKGKMEQNDLGSMVDTRVAGNCQTNQDEAVPTQLPKYYNPNIINPNKYAEQVQKRKLLWSGKKGEDNASKWGTAQFSQDTDGKVASKFMRLMGIKNSSGSATVPEKPTPTGTDVETREAMFSSMEQQYEVARQATHTMRGVGLGFSSQSRLF